jgi:PKD repeat protein
VILAILTNPAYVNEVTDRHQIDLERSSINPQPNECVFDTPNGPQADFTFSPDAPVVNQTVCFDAQATEDPTGVITSATWSFGDGGRATGLVACHEFGAEGSFNVTLTVQDENHNCDTVTQTVTVERGTPATCTIVVSPTSPDIGEDVLFTALITDPDGRARRLEWNFGDGSPRVRTSQTTITHSFDAAGSFTVILTVTDDQGNVSFCQATVTVGSNAPECSFTANPTTGSNPLTVTFDASGSSDDTGIQSLEWDFGDGGAASGTNVTHTFAADCTAPCSQNFNVTLTVTDEENQQSSCTQSITVNNP